ncbi:hypothetical protein ESA_03155 [Cronobacter sakazakii ATCC BAA-894]|uniref:Uncharacterized protein n=1 Tax=Cronobacter sakazakii (strain ATCC BAA-894) TaxID=290339 RepID=A7MI14_CROS8|nr:hypothetical protein ESA_03155 [Cronobacter sakazakii ATCC BAA-894]
MRAAQRFRDNAVDKLQLFQARRDDAHRFCRKRRFIGAFPENGSTAFRRDNGIGAVLQHIHFIANTDGQRAAGAAFTDNGTNNRHFQARHLTQVAGDSLRLTALFRAHTRICARGVDESNDGHVETLSHFHQAQRLTVTFRGGHTKVTTDFLFGFTAFLVADDHHRTPIQTRDAADDCFVVSVSAIACQFVKFVKRQADIIQGVRTLWMTRQLGNLPCAEIGKDFARQFYAFFTQTMHFFVDVNIQFLILTANRSQGIDFRFQLCNRLFKIKEIQTHSIPVLVKLQFHLLRTWQATRIESSDSGAWHLMQRISQTPVPPALNQSGHADR